MRASREAGCETGCGDGADIDVAGAALRRTESAEHLRRDQRHGQQSRDVVAATQTSRRARCRLELQ